MKSSTTSSTVKPSKPATLLSASKPVTTTTKSNILKTQNVNINKNTQVLSLMPHRRATIQLNNTIQTSGRILLASEIPPEFHRQIFVDEDNIPKYQDTIDYLSIPIGRNSEICTVDLPICPEDDNTVYWLSHRSNHPGPTGCEGKIIVPEPISNKGNDNERNCENDEDKDEDEGNRQGIDSSLLSTNTLGKNIPRSLQHIIPYAAMTLTQDAKPSPTTTIETTATTSTTTIQSSIQEQLIAKRKRIHNLQSEIIDELQKRARYENYMESLHTYNEIKDICQGIFGKYVELNGGVTKDLYSKYGLELDD